MEFGDIFEKVNEVKINEGWEAYPLPKTLEDLMYTLKGMKVGEYAITDVVKNKGGEGVTITGEWGPEKVDLYPWGPNALELSLSGDIYEEGEYPASPERGPRLNQDASLFQEMFDDMRNFDVIDQTNSDVSVDNIERLGFGEYKTGEDEAGEPEYTIPVEVLQKRMEEADTGVTEEAVLDFIDDLLTSR